MKKLKTFAIAAGMLLVTAGVFAGKSKFAGTYAIYSLSGSTYSPLTALVSLNDLTITQAGTQAQIVPSISTGNQSLWGYTVATGYEKLYTTF